MELWIRSQDKERLCKANNLFIKGLSICCSCNDEYNYYLGVYSTKERALEVLDEIQEYIIKSGQTEIITEDGINNEIVYYKNVYEMPKD